MVFIFRFKKIVDKLILWCYNMLILAENWINGSFPYIDNDTYGYILWLDGKKTLLGRNKNITV